MIEKTWILGPCSMEGESLYNEIADTLYPFMKGKDWYYKASFDKANRTSVKGGRSPGLEEGCEMFKNIKQKYPDIKLTTDVHDVHQVEKLAEAGIDCIQIPAFLCRQTDLIVECAKHFNIVNVKKMQFLGPDNVIKGVDKIKNTNPDCQAWLTDRGTNFGYDKLIVDFTIVDEIKKYYDKFIFDVTHATQRSREIYVKQADRDLGERYLLISDIMGYDGVFAETHPRPEEAVSDADSQIYLNKIKSVIDRADRIAKVL